MIFNINFSEDLFSLKISYKNYKLIFTKKSAGNISFQQQNFDEKVTSKNRLDLFNFYNINPFNVYNQILQHDKNYIIAKKPNSIEANKKESQIYMADAVLVLSNNLYGMITYADCIPLALINKKINASASIHLGSKSIIKGVINYLIDDWNKLLNIKNETWIAIVGPSIYPFNYEIKDDFYQLIKNSDKNLIKFVYKNNSSLYFDNRASLFYQLRKLKISNIFTIDIDTFSDQRFSSYRKEKPNHITQALLTTFF